MRSLYFVALNSTVNLNVSDQVPSAKSEPVYSKAVTLVKLEFLQKNWVILKVKCFAEVQLSHANIFPLWIVLQIYSVNDSRAD